MTESKAHLPATFATLALGTLLMLVALPGVGLAFAPAVLFDSPELLDGGYLEGAFNGLVSFEKHTGDHVAILKPEPGAPPSPEECVAMVKKALAEGREPIVSVGFSFADAFRELTPKNPLVRFVIIDEIVDAPNVASIVFREEEGSFLVGALAAMATKTNTVGFVGGMDCELIRRFGCGFAQGVAHQRPGVQVLTAMAGTTVMAWENPAKGEALAKAMIAQGADVIYHAAGRTGEGVIKACADAKVLAIGVDSNQNHLAPGFVLTSMLKRMDVALFLTLSEAKAGAWTPGTRRLGLKEGALDWAVDEHNIMLIDLREQEELDRLSFEIIAGLLRVHVYKERWGCPDIDFGPPPDAAPGE